MIALYLIFKILLCNRVYCFAVPDFNVEYVDYVVPVLQDPDFLNVLPVLEIPQVPSILDDDLVVIANDLSDANDVIPIEGAIKFGGNVRASGTVSIIGQTFPTTPTISSFAPAAIPSATLPFVTVPCVDLPTSTIPSVSPPFVPMTPLRFSSSVSSLNLPSVYLPCIIIPAFTIPSIIPPSVPTSAFPYNIVPSVTKPLSSSNEVGVTNGIPFSGIVPASGKVTIGASFGPSGNILNSFQRSSPAVVPSTVTPSIFVPPTTTNVRSTIGRPLVRGSIPVSGKVTIARRFDDCGYLYPQKPFMSIVPAPAVNSYGGSTYVDDHARHAPMARTMTLNGQVPAFGTVTIAGKF